MAHGPCAFRGGNGHAFPTEDLEGQLHSPDVNSLLKKGMITPAGFVKTFRNYARTFVPCMTEEEYAQLQLRDTTIQDPALVAPFLSAMIDTADDPASMIDELIVMLQKKREKLAAKKQT